MIESLLEWDTALFLKIHIGLSNSFFDFLMPLLRNKLFWTPLYLFIIVFCIKKYQKKGVYVILMLLFTFALGDLTASRIIKPLVSRVRPCNEVNLATQIIHRVDCGSGKSFPSAHATNHFAVAVFLILVFYHKWKLILPIGLLWAASICLAQIYVGVHYPVDIFCGTVLGISIAFFTFSLFKKIVPEL
ncbi:MAG: phosphatase PAP2 family protein [Sphingobacteriaceae bacterium]|nr:phosphatase PAP2 family protein [Sphingobacteriaceae bacterium]